MYFLLKDVFPTIIFPIYRRGSHVVSTIRFYFYKWIMTILLILDILHSL